MKEFIMQLYRVFDRRITHKISKLYSVCPPQYYNGIGCLSKFSIKAKWEAWGYVAVIILAIEKLVRNHVKHIAVYGSGYEERRTS